MPPIHGFFGPYRFLSIVKEAIELGSRSRINMAGQKIRRELRNKEMSHELIAQLLEDGMKAEKQVKRLRLLVPILLTIILVLTILLVTQQANNR